MGASRKAAKDVLPIAVIDSETEAFGDQREKLPFAWGFFDGCHYYKFWGPDCTRQLLTFLKSIEPHQIFAHNGGRFDFMFFLHHLHGQPLVINNRIVDCTLGEHIVSDSFARLPVALERFGEKIVIDYRIFASGKRDQPENKRKILGYLEQDCRLLYKLIFQWIDQYGRGSSTMASAAFKSCLHAMDKAELKKKLSARQDENFRQFYYGGRVQAFSLGVVRQYARINDVNSMYPAVMCNFQHPISANPADWRTSRDLRDDTDFAIIEAWSNGALPMRTDKGLAFPACHGRFHATMHEIRAGLKYKRLKISRVLMAYSCRVKSDFKPFIEPLYQARMEYKRAGNVMMVEFTKLLMNSCYGKYAINPRNFKEWVFISPANMGEFQPYEVTLPSGRTRLAIAIDGREFHCDKIGTPEQLWRFKRDKEPDKGFRNVATACSITGAARAVLLEALCHSVKPVYCDTDSIIAGDLQAKFSETELGAWKFEGEGDEILIGGKKTYAVMGDEASKDVDIFNRIKKYGLEYEPPDHAINRQAIKTIKLASKGSRLNIEQMRQVALGRAVTYTPFAPVFDVFGNQSYPPRLIKITNPEMVKPFPGELTQADINWKLERINL